MCLASYGRVHAGTSYSHHTPQLSKSLQRCWCKWRCSTRATGPERSYPLALPRLLTAKDPANKKPPLKEGCLNAWLSSWPIQSLRSGATPQAGRLPCAGHQWQSPARPRQALAQESASTPPFGGILSSLATLHRRITLTLDLYYSRTSCRRRPFPDSVLALLSA